MWSCLSILWENDLLVIQVLLFHDLKTLMIRGNFCPSLATVANAVKPDFSEPSVCMSTFDELVGAQVLWWYSMHRQKDSSALTMWLGSALLKILLDFIKKSSITFCLAVGLLLACRRLVENLYFFLNVAIKCEDGEKFRLGWGWYVRLL